MTPLEQEIIEIFTSKKNFDEGYKNNGRFCLKESDLRADTSDITLEFTEGQLSDALRNLEKGGFLAAGPNDTICLVKMP